MGKARLCEKARLVFFSASPRHFGFLNCETETLKFFNYVACHSDSLIQTLFEKPNKKITEQTGVEKIETPRKLYYMKNRDRETHIRKLQDPRNSNKVIPRDPRVLKDHSPPVVIHVLFQLVGITKMSLFSRLHRSFFRFLPRF